ncbi:MAG: NAD(P)H-dependent oxidoreductase, partial [Thermoplasmata archaeon]|nr:NAD(P)H-dependent oxidoreductase [Thermoplasmata archaeon]
MPTPLFLPVILGTVRDPRASAGVARFVARELARRPGVETHLYDPRELPLGNLVRREWEMSPPDAKVQSFVSEMNRADGFVIVTPEYNHGIPGTLKNLLDHLFDEWGRKPFGIVSAGGIAGGLRAAEMLRQVISGLSAISIPSQVPVFQVETAFNDEGPVSDTERWAQRLDRFFSELEWYARALATARAA